MSLFIKPTTNGAFKVAEKIVYAFDSIYSDFLGHVVVYRNIFLVFHKRM